MYVHFVFSSLLLKDSNVSIIIFINVKFCIAKIILLKCRPHQAKETFPLLQETTGKKLPVFDNRIRK